MNELSKRCKKCGIKKSSSEYNKRFTVDKFTKSNFGESVHWDRNFESELYDNNKQCKQCDTESLNF